MIAQVYPPLPNSVYFFYFFLQVKEVDLDIAIKCLAQNYKIFKDSGSGLEPVTLSIAERMDGMAKMNGRKSGTLPMSISHHYHL